MGFDRALQKAQELGGKTVKFDQGELDCCTGFAARWIKYNLLNLNFWENRHGKPPILTITNPKLSFNDGTSFTTQKTVMTEAGNEKIQGIYDSIDQSKADRKKAGKGTVNYLTKSKKVGDKYDSMVLRQHHGKLPGELRTLAARFADPNYVGAYHLSLQVDFDPDSGINPLFKATHNTKSLAFHSTAAMHKYGDKEVRYFDPNMGEVSLPLTKFIEWFEFYYGLWAKSNYRKFDCYVLTSIRGLDALVATKRGGGVSQYKNERRLMLQQRLKGRHKGVIHPTTKRPGVTEDQPTSPQGNEVSTPVDIFADIKLLDFDV